MKNIYTQEQIAKSRAEYTKGKTISKISAEQNIPRPTVANWIKRYTECPLYPPGHLYISHKIYKQDAHLKKLEGMCNILRQVKCSVDSPLKVKLYEMEKLTEIYPIHTLCAALCVNRGHFTIIFKFFNFPVFKCIKLWNTFIFHAKKGLTFEIS